MAKNVKVVLNRAGVRELLLSDAVGGYVSQLASGIASRAGSGYSYDNYTGRNRVNSSVYPETEEAWKDTLKNNTLLKAVR